MTKFLTDLTLQDQAVFILLSQTNNSRAFENGYAADFLNFVTINSPHRIGYVEITNENEEHVLNQEEISKLKDLVGNRKVILLGKNTVKAIAGELINNRVRYLSLLDMSYLTCANLGKVAICGHPMSYKDVFKGNVDAQQKLILRVDELIQPRAKEYEVEIVAPSLDDLEDILNLCANQPAIGYDIEANDLDIWAAHWEKNLFSLSVFESESKLMSFWFNWREFTSDHKRLFENFLDKNQSKIWTYNCTYEIQAAWRVFGKRYLFQDALILTTMDANRGDLKTNARKYLKCDFWEDELASIRDVYEAFFKLFLDKGKKNSIHDEFKAFVKSDQFQNLDNLREFLISKGRKPEWMNDINDLAVALGEDEVVKGISEFPYQWSAVPFDILGKYCCYDSAYTLPIAAKLYGKYEKGYKHYIKHPWLACIFEAWGCGWDESKAKEVEKDYLRLMNESLSELILNLQPKLGLRALDVKPILQWKLPHEATSYTATGKERKHKVLSEYDRHGWIKGIYNPGSNTADARAVFWDVYLTERVELATFAYTLVNDLRFRGIWEKLLIKMIEMTEFKSKDESKTENEFLTEYGAAQVLEMLSVFLENPNLTDRETVKILASSFTETNKTYKDNTGRNAKEVMAAQYEIQCQFFGVDIDDESTWTPEFKILFLLQKYKKVAKALSTYVNGKLGRGCVWLSKVFPDRPPVRLKPYHEVEEGYKLKLDEKLIAFYDFNSLSASTHRWGSGFHTISPGVAIRSALVPYYSNQIWTHIDFSQAELVMLAFFSQDPNMIKVFMEGGDMHRYVASLVYQKKPEDVTSEERRVAKTVSFGIVYGKGIENLALEITGGDVPRAQAIFDAFFVSFPGIKKWMDERKTQGRETGKVTNLFGALIEVEDGFSKGNAIDRHSVNYPIQSSSSMVAGGSMYDLCSTVDQQGIFGTGVGFVHDALDHTVDIDNLVNFLVYSKKVMQDQVYEELGTPMKIDQEIGATALDLCELKSFTELENGLEIILGGDEEAVNKLVDKFRVESAKYVIDNTEIIDSSDSYTSWEGLFTEKGAYSSDRGQTLKKVKTKVTLRYS